MKIMGNTIKMGLMIGILHWPREQLKERKTFWQYRLQTFYLFGLNEKKEYLY